MLRTTSTRRRFPQAASDLRLACSQGVDRSKPCGHRFQLGCIDLFHCSMQDLMADLFERICAESPGLINWDVFFVEVDNAFSQVWITNRALRVCRFP